MSTTLTVLVAVDELPESSVAVYVTVYVPTEFVLTLLDNVKSGFGSLSSDTVAPASE